MPGVLFCNPLTRSLPKFVQSIYMLLDHVSSWQKRGVGTTEVNVDGESSLTPKEKSIWRLAGGAVWRCIVQKAELLQVLRPLALFCRWQGGEQSD